MSVCLLVVYCVILYDVHCACVCLCLCGCLNACVRMCEVLCDVVWRVCVVVVLRLRFNCVCCLCSGVRRRMMCVVLFGVRVCCVTMCCVYCVMYCVMVYDSCFCLFVLLCVFVWRVCEFLRGVEWFVCGCVLCSVMCCVCVCECPCLCLCCLCVIA